MPPSCQHSRAATRCALSVSDGRNEAACASETGNIVRQPWMTSSAQRMGMPRRVLSTAMRWKALRVRVSPQYW